MTTKTPLSRTDLPPAPAVDEQALWTKVRDRYLGYWEGGSRLWSQSRWLGTLIEKLPTDAWIYQELIASIRPDVLVETGTLAGGSALFFASIMDMVGHGQVITVDIADDRFDVPRPVHPRITYVTGSAIDPKVFARVQQMVADWIPAGSDGKVMVVLDDDHTAPHVRRELEMYPALVTPGSYLVVEDTSLFGELFGAAEAVEDWLPTQTEFARDPRCERFLITAHPGGYLRRLKEGER